MRERERERKGVLRENRENNEEKAEREKVLREGEEKREKD